MNRVSESGNVLLINGHRKSGTTLLSLLFDGHPQILSIPSDINCLYAYYPNWCSASYSKSEKLARFQRVTIQDWFSTGAIDQRELQLGEIYLSQNQDLLANHKTVTDIFDFTIDLLRHTKQRYDCLVVCKETSTEIYQSTIKSNSIHKVRTLTIYRDPRDNIAALKRGSEKYYEPLGDTWHSTFMSSVFRIKLSHAYGFMDTVNKPLDHKSIRYEDLCGNSSDTIRLLTDWLAVDFNDSLLSPTFNGRPYWGNSFSDSQNQNIPGSKIEGLNIGRWSNVLTRSESALIEILLEQMLKDLDYSFSLSESDYQHAAVFYATLSNSLFFSDRF